MGCTRSRQVWARSGLTRSGLGIRAQWKSCGSWRPGCFSSSESPARGLSAGDNVVYKTPKAKALLSKYTAWNKQHRRILGGDIVHVRRATGRSWDCIGHADPTCTASEAACFRGLFLCFNPTANNYSTRVTLPLRYTGAERGGNVSVSWMGGGGSVRPFVMKTLAADTPASAVSTWTTTSRCSWISRQRASLSQLLRRTMMHGSVLPNLPRC